eukprot:4279057-Lingulodinium_polyedra.AAC.1
MEDTQQTPTQYKPGLKSTVGEKEPQPTTPPCPWGLGLLPKELPPSESVGYKVTKECGDGDGTPPRCGMMG